MKTKLFILFIAPIAIFTSCKTTVRRAYKVSQPKIESLESVREALSAYSPDYPDYLCIFRDSAALVDWFRHKNLPGRSQFYASDGSRIITQDSLFCAYVEAVFAGNLKPDFPYRIDSSVKFSELKRNLLFLGKKADPDISKYAFTCVIFWARFMGKFNESSLEIAGAALKSRPGQSGKVNLLMVNMDMLDSWNVSEKMIKMDIDKRK